MSTQARHSVALGQLGPELASFHCVHVGRADEFVYRLDRQIAASRIPYHVELRPSVGGRPIVVASAAPAHVPALQRAIEAAGASAWTVRPADVAAERR